MSLSNDQKALARLLEWATDINLGKARPIEQLLQSNEPLRGMEAQSLREWFTFSAMDPTADLDPFSAAVFAGDVTAVKEDFSKRVSRLRETLESDEAAQHAAAQELYKLRYGETLVTIYGLILISLFVHPQSRVDLLELTRFLVNEAKVPLDGTDASGTTVLAHAIDTRPSFEIDFAQILYDANANVMARNRYGGTAAHEIVLVHDMNNEGLIQKAANAMQWFLAHGGNIDVTDNDGMSARMVIESIRERIRHTPLVHHHALLNVIDREDERRIKAADEICKFCGREPEGTIKLLLCGRCGKVRYCSAPRRCQRDDWPSHKMGCKKPR